MEHETARLNRIARRFMVHEKTNTKAQSHITDHSSSRNALMQTLRELDKTILGGALHAMEALIGCKPEQ